MRIAGNTNAAALPVWLGIQRGYFKDCGIDAKYTVVQNITTLPAALGRSFDLALTVPPVLISAASQGLPVVEVAGATLNSRENPQTFLVAKEGSGINTVADLRGKKLGVQTITGSTHLGTKLWLKRAGVPYDSVQIVQVDGPAMADQLRSGRVDAMETLAPFSTSVLKHGKSIVDPQAAVASTVSGIFWAADEKWASSQSKAISCFQQGLKKSADFIGSNTDEAKQVLKQQTKLPDDIVNGTDLPTYTAEVRPDDLKLWEDAMKEVGGFKGDVDVKNLVLAG
ncbi:ABC transporter substrate-binding protein [Micromonospora sp. U21]|uniref:ABC transporter substrate-binding protein n=1 Tax=Micromonospora sp. U21 TaxID=2824899 RepID=UPI001B3755E6|nr:ABC transporter substrate-binding protein [Micromonospora sp. U21]MBQ0905014.1 ABC transporter substrate-binding protein [Micromonospora sp. U21]